MLGYDIICIESATLDKNFNVNLGAPLHRVRHPPIVVLSGNLTHNLRVNLKRGHHLPRLLWRILVFPPHLKLLKSYVVSRVCDLEQRT